MKQFILLLIILSHLPRAGFGQAPAADPWKEAAANGERAHEVFSRCTRLVHAWYEHKGANNFLLPQNLKSRVWNGENSAADLWSFFVLTSWLADRAAYDTLITRTFEDEVRLTTRLGNLPDQYHIDQNQFVREEPDLARVIFGASEYVKDGLLPIVELMGRTAFFERSRGILDDIFAHAPLETKHGKLPGDGAEVNGEMLQNLCRFYSATGDPKYKEWAERIGDAYFLDALPKSNYLPCHHWDFAAGKPRDDRLSLSDHGNEIVFGLSELAVLEHVHDPEKAKQYLPAMRRMLDTLLEIAVNEDGLWVHSVQPSTKKVLRKNTPDTWGYALDAVYAFYLITGEEKYRAAVRRALRGINAQPKYREWGGSDAFADSLESGIVLLNREPEPEGFAWLEATMPTLLQKQRADGIVEGWHGDGNYARTALMYALMKTAGTRVRDWRPGVKFGAAVRGETLHVLVAADQPWTGELHFDYPRHRMHFGLTINYPRLNEFPEWYTVEPARLYAVKVGDAAPQTVLGHALIGGWRVAVKDAPVKITVRPLPGPPYGERGLRLKAPPKLYGDGARKLTVAVKNRTGAACRVKLASSQGEIKPAQLELKTDEEGQATVTLNIAQDGEVEIRVEADDGAAASAKVRLVHDKDVVDYAAFNDQQYAERGYAWTGKAPLELTLQGRGAGKPHTLHLLWGAKGGKRRGVLTVNGQTQRLEHGGYDGFQWLKIKIPAEQVKGEAIKVILAEDPNTEKDAFISELKLTSP